MTYESVPSMFDESGAPPAGERLVAPVAGLYSVAASFSFSTSPNGHRTLLIAKNDVTNDGLCAQRPQASSFAGTYVNVSCMVPLAAGEFVTFKVAQSSGLTLTAGQFASASLTWIGNLP